MSVVKTVSELMELASISELKKLRDDIIPPSQREVLEVLYGCGKSTTKEISQRLDKPYQQIARDLNSLKQKGIVVSEIGRRKTKFYKIRDEYLDKVRSIVTVEMLCRAYESQIKKIMSDSTLTPEQKNQAIRKFDEILKEELPNFLNNIMKNSLP